VESIRERRNKRGDGRHAFVMIEDRFGRVEMLTFAKVYVDCEELLKSGQPVLCHGSVRIEGDDEPRERKIVCNRVQLLSEARMEAVSSVTIRVEAGGIDHDVARSLREVLAEHKGACRTFLELAVPAEGHARFSLPADLAVAPTDAMLQGVERLLGRGCVRLS